MSHTSTPVQCHYSAQDPAQKNSPCTAAWPPTAASLKQELKRLRDRLKSKALPQAGASSDPAEQLGLHWHSKAPPRGMNAIGAWALSKVDRSVVVAVVFGNNRACARNASRLARHPDLVVEKLRASAAPLIPGACPRPCGAGQLYAVRLLQASAGSADAGASETEPTTASTASAGGKTSGVARAEQAASLLSEGRQAGEYEVTYQQHQGIRGF